MRLRHLLLAVCLVVAQMAAARAAEGLRVLAAGSLREVVGEITARYKQATGTEIAADFGPSGVLRERIERGEPVDLFASADMGHPLKLLADGRAVRVAMFTRNALCGFTVPKVGLTAANFLERLVDPAVKLGTSTPKADPAGDYTWLMFRRAETVRPGAYAVLDGKAQKIVGGPGAGSGREPSGRSALGRRYRRDDRLLQRPRADACGDRRPPDRRGAHRDRRQPRIRAGGSQGRRPPRRRSRAVHAVAGRPAGFRQIWLCPGGFADRAAIRFGRRGFVPG